MTDNGIKTCGYHPLILLNLDDRGCIGILRVAKTSWIFTFCAAAYNLVRMRNLGAVATW